MNLQKEMDLINECYQSIAEISKQTQDCTEDQYVCAYYNENGVMTVSKQRRGQFVAKESIGFSNFPQSRKRIRRNLDLKKEELINHMIENGYMDSF
jgi:hypothetical protein